MINVAVEGESDREAARAVAAAAGHEVHLVRVAGGKSKLDPLIPKYSAASRQVPWVVFRDSDSECPVNLAQRLTAAVRTAESNFRLRIAHTMTEAWLLADRASFAAFLGVSRSLLPSDAESEPHAKRTVLRLAARSRFRTIRQEMVAEDGDVGPLYVNLINEYAAHLWRPDVAKDESQSLRRAIARISELPH